MTRDRDRLTLTLYLVGTAAAILGFVGIASPELALRLAGGIPVMNVVGIAALGLAVHSALTRYDTDHTPTTLPDVVANTTTHLPGADLDTALQRRDGTARSQVYATLRALLAVETDDDTAESLIESGDWTDDDHATAFLTPTTSPRDGLWGRLRDRLTTPRAITQAQAAVDALLDRADITLPPADPGPEPSDGDRVIEALPEDGVITRSTDRWTGLAAFPLLAVAIAIFTRSPLTLLVGGIGVAFVGFVRVTAATTPAHSVSLERRIDDPNPDEHDRVRVTLAITNDGNTTIPDLRLGDGIPPALTVNGGHTTTATTLPPGDTTAITYALTAKHGVHCFDPPYLITRDYAGTTERIARPSTDGPPNITCVPPLDEPGPPPRTRTTPYAGRVDTTTGGQGVEFFSTREYQHGDPLSRVNWKRLARTGELSTIDFRRERAAAVVLLIDTRETARVAPTYEAAHAVERSVQAARRLAGGYLDAGDQVGLGTLGPTTHWTPPSAGPAHRAHLRRTLADDPAFSPRATDAAFQAATAVTTFRTRLTDGTNLVLCTPLVDDWAASVARRLAARTAVTVVSPDPTGDASVGTRIAAIDRARRISELRSDDIPVLDWGIDDSFAAVLARRNRR